MKSALSTPVAIIIGSLLISVSILLSSGTLKLKGLNPPQSALGLAPSASLAPSTAQESPEPAKQAKVSVDDDPMIGDKNAPVTIIEFSDYECPFCKRYFEQTYVQIKKDYIDTGKVKLVFRDLPLDFHQNAHKEAQAAQCARNQGGDSVYFKYHDEIFERTTSNGTGLSLDALPEIAGDLGLNVANFQLCSDSDKYKAEVDKDVEDAQGVGATGTPSFFIGKSSNDGLIDGKMLVGAQPYSIFKSGIDPLLK